MTTFAELRAYLTTRPAWEYRLWAGSIVASFAIIALDALPTSLWGWLIGSILAASCAALAAWGLDMRRARAAAEQLCDARYSGTGVVAVVSRSSSPSAAPNSPSTAPARATRLRVMPEQRDGSEYEWPALAREIEHDEWTALMRAVEED